MTIEIISTLLIILATLTYSWSWVVYSKWQFKEREFFGKYSDSRRTDADRSRHRDLAYEANKKWHAVKWVNQVAFFAIALVAFDYAFFDALALATGFWIVFDMHLNVERGLAWSYLGKTAKVDVYLRQASDLLNKAIAYVVKLVKYKKEIVLSPEYFALGLKAITIVIFAIL